MRFPLPAAVRLRIAAGLAAVLLLLTGCGPTAATTPPPATPPAAPATVPSSPSPAAVSSAPSAAPVATTSPPLSVPAPTAPPAATGGSCPANDYRNVDGTCVPRPTQAPAAPAGATAQCNDGTYSFSTHRSGTCSHHGGVRRWL